uniref:protein adenylyltransferase FICD-like isoform X2 n=1 Tax=Styela clava TaxID=7725 RepID=UPI00193ACC9C|nr:protein adenylyltransferase FICD-like isoform X2 [Styela clava]
MLMSVIEVNRGKLETIKHCVSGISAITQDLTKLCFYVTILVVLSSVLFQYVRVLYTKEPQTDLPSYYTEYSGFNGDRSLETQEENHFGQLLPKEYLLEQDTADQSLNDLPGVKQSNFLTRRLVRKTSNYRDARHEEAVMSLKKAKQLSSKGNKKLAIKLFQHALALEPEFPDALNVYGEFLEDDNNIMQADLLYQRALTYEPSHSTALANRERTLPIVEELDKNMLSEIDQKKTELYKYPPHNNNLRKAMKEFYYQHIYHTVALEGNTMTIDEIREIINSRNGIAGKSIYEHNEVIGVDEALKYLNNTLLLNIGSVTVDQIKEIHKRVIGFVDPLNAGVFRSNQVYVGKHIPPHPREVPKYMEEFNDWLNSEEAERLHPVEFAALAHYKLVYVHPFIDGNGRTSRLLMNLILMRSGFPPVSIQSRTGWPDPLQAGQSCNVNVLSTWSITNTYNICEMKNYKVYFVISGKMIKSCTSPTSS